MRVSYRSLAAFALAVATTLGWNPSPAQAESEADIAVQQDRQKQIQAETDSMVRRLGTMLRVLDYYQFDKAGERKMLEEMTGVLAGLSKNQMAEVIRRLEAAARANDEGKSNKEIEQAYGRHREILDALKTLLTRYDAVRNLDEAAERLDKYSKTQLELHFLTNQLLKDSLDLANPNLSPTERLLLSKRRNLKLEPKRQGDDQIEIHHDVDRVIQQVLGLQAKLPDEQKERVRLMKKLAAEQRLLENLNSASNKLKAPGAPAQRYENWKEVNAIQWKAAGDMKELARVLRISSELLAVLREARDRIDQVIVKQDELNKETKENVTKADENKEKEAAKPPIVFPDLEPLPTAPRATKEDRKASLEKAIKEAQAKEKVQELRKEQARVEYDTKDTADLVKPHVEDLAKKIEKAEQAMKDSKDALAKNQPKEATEPQDKAAETLKDVRKELDKLIADAEKQKNDPLTALKKAAEELEKIIKDQTDTRDKTKDTAKDQQNQKAPELAKDQKNLANRTEQLKDTPLPNKDTVKDALDKANKAMKEAAKALDDKKANNAVPKQEQALKALNEAKKDIADKLAELEQRRDDLAKLEDAANKLDELAKAEKNIADKAKDMSAKPEPAASKDLAKNQEKLTPEAKDVAKNLEAAAPEAANKVNESTKNMEAAKKELDKNKADTGAAEAKEAANKLEEAQKAIAKAIDVIKGKDLADQAALQPNKVDPQAAAQQIAKALEQTEKAADQAKQAEKLSGQEAKAKADLAKLQADIGKKAEQMKLPAAAKDANKAADALKEGDLGKAIENQEKALAKLQDAADKNPGEPKAGEAKGSEAKDGDPMAAEPKGNPENAKAGEPKTGEPKAGEPKAGEAKAGQPKSGEAKPGQPEKGGQQSGQPELAQAQKDVMEATKALAKSQEATQAAMAALGQAQAQAPKGIQKQLDDAGKELAKASDDLQKGQPAEAGQNQAEAAKDLGAALKALNAALEAMNQPQAQPGQPSSAQAKADPGQEAGKEGEDMGKEDGMGPGKEGQGKTPNQGKGKEPGKSQEKNEQKGKGDRVADGKTSNGKSQLNDVNGDGSFLHLPPRQRELIRQALSGQLPPEYAAMIQQYYINIARGRAAGGAAPATPSTNR